MEYAIRFTLTAGLIYLVYGEAGPWTALSLGLIAITTEIQSVLLKRPSNHVLRRFDYLTHRP